MRANYRSQLEADRIETLGRLSRVNNELDKSRIRDGLLEIRAPQSGVVKDLAITTPGAVVAAGSLLMNIVPQNEPLQAEVLLKNEDVGFVGIGQAVRLKVAAFPFQKYGMLDGTVSLVGADAMELKPGQPVEVNQPTRGYKALVKLNSEKLDGPIGPSLALGAGMLVIAEVHQGRQSVIEYLLSPARKVAQEAARER